jgi:hypothetical protein
MAAVRDADWYRDIARRAQQFLEKGATLKYVEYRGIEQGLAIFAYLRKGAKMSDAHLVSLSPNSATVDRLASAVIQAEKKAGRLKI